MTSGPMTGDLLLTVRNLGNARDRVAHYERLLAEEIRDALAAGHRAAEIAEATGLSRQRIYQIRDGRR